MGNFEASTIARWDHEPFVVRLEPIERFFQVRRFAIVDASRKTIEECVPTGTVRNLFALGKAYVRER